MYNTSLSVFVSRIIWCTYFKKWLNYKLAENEPLLKNSTNINNNTNSLTIISWDNRVKIIK